MNSGGRLIIFSAPSGSGKTTLAKALLSSGWLVSFSVSATTRQPRQGEKHGREYYFITENEFRQHIEADDFLEYEEVYSGIFYGTLKKEVDEKLKDGQHVVFDIDVMGGLNIKKIYGELALAIFIMPPDLDKLEQRLRGRQTETPETIEKRLQKAHWEISFAEKFDLIVVNDKLEDAIKEVTGHVKEFIGK